MANNLLTPILNDMRSVNFFNGRLLTGEDLTAEQKANRVARGLLGQAIGSGVAYGFEVSESKQSSSVQAPVLAVTQGLAINRNGTTLRLQNDTEIALVRPADASTAPVNIFQDCTPVQSGVYVADAGVYLLTTGPAGATQGLAEVSGVNTGSVPCNSNYKVEGVQFRLVKIDLTQDEMADVNHVRGVSAQADASHLRNLVAYRCFGVADQASVVTDPFGTPPAGFGLIDQLRATQIITDCEVPLGLFYWTATDGLVFVDMWSVRRPVFSRDLLNLWAPGASRRRVVEGLAMFLQFQTQLRDLLAPLADGSTIQAGQFFRYLPPVGFLPISGLGVSKGVNYLTFFTSHTFRKPEFVEGARLNSLVHDAFEYPPVDLNDNVMARLYWVRENTQTINTAVSAAPNAYVVFASGHLRNYGSPHFDVNRWDYSTYA